MKFGQAIDCLQSGHNVMRSGWNGKRMFLFLVKSYDYELHGNPVTTLGLEKSPWICMKTADGKLVPWLASQTDVLASDWEVVP